MNENIKITLLIKTIKPEIWINNSKALIDDINSSCFLPYDDQVIDFKIEKVKDNTIEKL